MAQKKFVCSVFQQQYDCSFEQIGEWPDMEQDLVSHQVDEHCFSDDPELRQKIEDSLIELD